MDLGVLNDLSKYNKQFRHLLVCIDVYSHFAFVKLLKKKSKNAKKKFESIMLESGEILQKIQCDEGWNSRKFARN